MNLKNLKNILSVCFFASKINYHMSYVSYMSIFKRSVFNFLHEHFFHENFLHQNFLH